MNSSHMDTGVAHGGIPMIGARALALVACASLGLAACGSSSSAGATETLKIGSVAPLTGAEQAVGVDEKNGVDLCISQINDAGGIKADNGTTYKLTLDAKDDQADAQLAVTAAQQLVDDGVVAVVGHLNSGATIPASKIYNDNTVTMISPSATNNKVTHQGFKYAFRVVGEDSAQGKADADYMVKVLGFKKIGIMDDSTAYGKGLADFVEQNVTADGGTVVGHEHTTKDDRVFTSQLTSLKGKSPDAIFVGSLYEVAGPASKQMGSLGLNVPLVGGDGIHSGQYFVNGGRADGDYASDAGPDNASIPAFQDFNTKYKAKFGQDVVQYAVESYDACNIIAKAIKTAGKDKAKIRDAVAATSGFKGIAQTYTFDPNGDILNAVFSLYKGQGGKWTFVKTVTG
jgi:branched-chain amino acid transport system substrate-binding protein